MRQERVFIYELGTSDRTPVFDDRGGIFSRNLRTLTLTLPLRLDPTTLIISAGTTLN
jgi:hypothetical protein